MKKLRVNCLIILALLLSGCFDHVSKTYNEDAEILSINTHVLSGEVAGAGSFVYWQSHGYIHNDINKIGIKIALPDDQFILEDVELNHAQIAYYCGHGERTLPVSLLVTSLGKDDHSHGGELGVYLNGTFLKGISLESKWAWELATRK